MKVAFICGPYNSGGSRKHNIKLARSRSIMLWDAGIPNICPHTNSANFDDEVIEDRRIFEKGYLEILGRCDVVLELLGSEDSPGATEELILARKLEIPIYKENELDRLVKYCRKDKADGMGIEDYEADV